MGEYELLAPVGSLSGCVDLGKYLAGVFQSAIGIAGILAVIMIVVCGIQLMAAGSVSGKSAAKECITNAIFGLLLAIGSWLILNTINPFLVIGTPTAGINAADLSPAVHTATNAPNPTQKGCYFQYKDLVSGDTRFNGADTCPACETLRNSVQADSSHYEILSSCYDPKITGGPSASTPPPITSVSGSVTCPLTGANLCETKYRQCTNPNCAQFAGLASKNATGNASGELLKAIILQESSCGLALVGDGGASCGPTHIQPATANKFLAECGLKSAVSCGWLTQKENWDKALCLSAHYINSLASACGSNIQDLAAGYNGGAGACSNSANCGSDSSCSGGSVKKWECLYDNNAHTECNAGYNSTRNYAMQVNYCTTNPGY